MNSQPMQTTLQELVEAGKIVEYSIGSYSGMAEYMVWIDPTEPAGTVLRIQEEAGASRVSFHQA
jgi:hypothetical protein